MFPIEGLDDCPIAVLGSFESIGVYKIEGGHLFFRVDRPLSAKSGEIPVFCFGLGKSPTMIEKTHLLLAFAWGNVIQLIVM